MRVAEALSLQPETDRRFQVQRRERNQRYWQKLKDDPQRLARRREANAKHMERFQMRKKMGR